MTTHERRIIAEVVAAWDYAEHSPDVRCDNEWHTFKDAGGVEPLRQLLKESEKRDD